MKKIGWRHLATASFVLVVPYTILFLFTACHPIMGTVLWLSFLGFLCASFFN